MVYLYQYISIGIDIDIFRGASKKVVDWAGNKMNGL
jgi:hypothetical protein